jgi:hypothetical protein
VRDHAGIGDQSTRRIERFHVKLERGRQSLGVAHGHRDVYRPAFWIRKVNERISVIDPLRIRHALHRGADAQIPGSGTHLVASTNP